MAKKYDVFISYSRKDSERVNCIVNLLSAKGISAWIDKDGIENGDAFKTVIVSAIENSRVFLFLSSISSNSSEWTVKEVNLAIYKKKPIIPIGASRVIIGGSWSMGTRGCRASYHDKCISGKRGYDLGFRLVLDLLDE